MFVRRRHNPVQNCLWDSEAPPGRDPYLVLVPGIAAPIYRLDLPTGLRGAARTRVARQFLADKLTLPAAGLDILPITRPGRRASDWDRVICVDASDRQRWCAAALARHKRALAVLPDYFGLPGQPETLSLSAEGGQVRARLGLDDGFTAPAHLAAILLGKALTQGTWSRAVAFSDLPAAVSEAIAAAGLAVVRASRDDMAWAAPDLAFDLRQAETADAQNESGPLRTVLGATVLALFAFTIWAASVILDIRTIERDTTVIRQSMTDVLRAGILPEGPILDIRQQVTQKVEAAAGDGADAAEAWPLDRLSLISVALFGKGARVQSITFEPERGHSAIVLTRDFETAEALLEALRADDLAPVDRRVSARAEGDVELRFRVPAPTVEGGR